MGSKKQTFCKVVYRILVFFSYNLNKKYPSFREILRGSATNYKNFVLNLPVKAFIIGILRWMALLRDLSPTRPIDLLTSRYDLPSSNLY